MPIFKEGMTMELGEQLVYIKEHFPEAWEYLLGVDNMKVTLPNFDENDDMYFTQQERSEHNGNSISESWPCPERQP